MKSRIAISIVNPTPTNLTGEECQEILEKLGILFSSFSPNSTYMLKYRPNGTPRVELELVREDFINRMRKMLVYFEKKYEHFIRNLENPCIVKNPEAPEEPSMPYLILETELAAMMPRQAYYVNEVFRALGVNIYIENIINGQVVTFGAKADFERFLELFAQM